MQGKALFLSVFLFSFPAHASTTIIYQDTHQCKYRGDYESMESRARDAERQNEILQKQNKALLDVNNRLRKRLEDHGAAK